MFHLHGMHLLFALALLVTATVWLEAVLKLKIFFVKDSWRPQLHHFYFGALALLLGPNIWWWLAGLAVAIDDAYQHWRQQWEPTYLSPLHIAYNVVYRWFPKWLQRICDRL